MRAMSKQALPPALERRSDQEAIREDIAPYLGTTVEQRAEIMEALCRLAAEQIAANPQGARILQHVDPRSPESERLWLRLVGSSR